MIAIDSIGWNRGDKVKLMPGKLSEYQDLLEYEGFYPVWKMWKVTEDTELTIDRVGGSTDVILSMELEGGSTTSWRLYQGVTKLLTHVTPIPVSECEYVEGDKIKLMRGKWADFIRDVNSVKFIPVTAIKHLYEYGVATINGVDIDGDVFIEFDGGSGYMSPELLKYFEFVGEDCDEDL